MLGAGLPLGDAVVFAIGLLVGNVPEGLLPVITLALAVGVRGLARQGAVVKRLSAVETLGSTDVICTDKTGTLTENRMRVTGLWTAGGALDVERGRCTPRPRRRRSVQLARGDGRLQQRPPRRRRRALGDPTEVGAARRGRAGSASTSTPRRRDAHRRAQFHFDPGLQADVDGRRATTGQLWVDAKGAPEALLAALHGDRSARTAPLDR